MVAGSALLDSLHDSLHSSHLGISIKDHHAWESTPHGRKSAHAATSFDDPKEGSGSGKHVRMGRTEEDSPCECTDPLKKKKSGGILKSLLGGGVNRDHDAVMVKFKKEQRAAERKNADTLEKGPYHAYIKSVKSLEHEVLQSETDYAAFRAKHDEYSKAYYDLGRAMKWHCNGIRKQYKGVRFDCERERLEAQAQFFARRHAPECLIGETTPFDAHGDESGFGHKNTFKSVLMPPEVVLLSNFIASGTPDSSRGMPASVTSSHALLTRPQHSPVGQERHSNAAARAFL